MKIARRVFIGEMLKHVYDMQSNLAVRLEKSTEWWFVFQLLSKQNSRDWENSLGFVVVKTAILLFVSV